MPFDPSGLDTPGVLLLEAADYIEKNGWCQKMAYQHSSNGMTSSCAIWALVLMRKGDFKNWDIAVNRLSTYTEDGNIPNWNDTPGRTKEEVVSALREAAFNGENR